MKIQALITNQNLSIVFQMHFVGAELLEVEMNVKGIRIGTL